MAFWDSIFVIKRKWEKAVGKDDFRQNPWAQIQFRNTFSYISLIKISIKPVVRYFACVCSFYVQSSLTLKISSLSHLN